MTTGIRKITVDEFWEMAADPGHRYELVDGELIDMDGVPRHGRVVVQLGRMIANHVDNHRLPLDVGSSTGFAMGTHTLRFPDVHVTRWERMAGYDEDAGGFPHFAPDVAIEVVSPSNTARELERKTSEYFANGASAVWIADPALRSVIIRRPGVTDQTFGPEDTLDGNPEIPGFVCAVADIFSVLDPRRHANVEDA